MSQKNVIKYLKLRGPVTSKPQQYQKEVVITQAY